MYQFLPPVNDESFWLLLEMALWKMTYVQLIQKRHKLELKRLCICKTIVYLYILHEMRALVTI